MGDMPLPPGPKGRLLTGHLREFRGDRLSFYVRCARDFGDVVALRFVSRRVFLVSHPDLIESVLVTHARNYIKHFALRLNPLVLGQGLLTSEGDFWLRQRRLIQPAFQRQRLASFAGEMVAAAERHLAGWAPGQAKEIDAEMSRLTLDVTGRTLFGADVTGDAADVGEAMRVLQRSFLALFTSLLPVPPWMPTPTNLRLRRAVRRLDAIIYRLIAERRATAADRGDLLSLLLAARDEEDGGGMSDRQVRDEALTLFLAGHETTALALSWTWYLLGRHPEVEARLAAEWRQVLGGRPPTFEDLPRLRYTERVVLESLRLYPPAPTIGREALAECALGGFRVPAGTTILLSPWVVHRDPRWYDRPEEFRPERWADGAGQRPKYAYFPFGGGPRLCIGNNFALMEAALVLATLGQRYRFTLVPDHPVAVWPTVTLRARDGIRAVLQER
jgi:cytochrome P450